MRFVDDITRIAVTGCAVAALAGCAMFGDKAEPAAAQASVAAASKPAAPAKETVPKAEAARPATRPEVPPVSAAVQRAFDAARQAYAAGRLADAERGFAALTRSSPELAGPHANLGLIYRQTSKFKEAAAELEKAVQLSPDRPDLHNQLGISYRMAGDFDKARAAYEKSISLDPGYAPAVLNLGILHDLYLWDGARALELYDRYLQLAPGGDDQVKRWISDLRNRSAQKSAAGRKEQG